MIMSKTLAPLTSLALVVALCTLTAPASAKDNPCSADAKKFCATAQHGGGRIKACLKEHQADLSDACKAHIEKANVKHGEHHQACAADIQKFCKDVKHGGGRIASCLTQHEADLSAECKAAQAAHHHSKVK